MALRVAPERCNILMCKRITAPAQGHERRDVFRRRDGMSAAKETREERSDLKVASYNHQVRQRSNRWAAQPCQLDRTVRRSRPHELRAFGKVFTRESELSTKTNQSPL